MDCVLMRHGIAVEREKWQGGDDDRPLTDAGAKRTAQVAAGLAWSDVNPIYVLSSPLARAADTAEIVREVLHVRSAVRLVDELLPESGPEELLTVLQRLPPESCVVCVGHEPHLSASAGLMLAGKPTGTFAFKKAGACLIEFPGQVMPGKGILRWWMGPAQLRTLGK